jgi:5-methylcytosine-specific restriction endonuclease McrA
MPSKMCAYCHAVMPSNQIERHKRKYRGDMRGTRQWRRLRQLMIDRDAGCCTVCGSTGQLEVHHVDGNVGDNDPSNLTTLCRGCHAARHPT